MLSIMYTEKKKFSIEACALHDALGAKLKEFILFIILLFQPPRSIGWHRSLYFLPFPQFSQQPYEVGKAEKGQLLSFVATELCSLSVDLNLDVFGNGTS